MGDLDEQYFMVYNLCSRLDPKQGICNLNHARRLAIARWFDGRNILGLTLIWIGGGSIAYPTRGAALLIQHDFGINQIVFGGFYLLTGAALILRKRYMHARAIFAILPFTFYIVFLVLYTLQADTASPAFVGIYGGYLLLMWRVIYVTHVRKVVVPIE
jgi:hypothetical protein